jgi:uncharacterized protein YkwD
MGPITISQHVRLAIVQGCVPLPGRSNRRWSGLAPALAAVLLACTAALAAPRTAAGSAHPPTAKHQAAAGCRDANLPPDSADARAVEAATLCLVNRERAAYRLRPLRANPELAAAAAGKAASMVREDYFADVAPTPSTSASLVALARYHAHAAHVVLGEDLAWGTGSQATARRIVAQWLASPAHRAIILSAEYRDAGIEVMPAVPALLHAGGRGATYAMELGARQPSPSATPAPTPSLSR